MNNLDKQYQSLLQDILDNGVDKSDRTGTGTRSVFGKQIRHNMSEGFPLLTTKKMAIKSIMTELKWFLKGDTNIKYLVENGCNIWNGDAHKRYDRACRWMLELDDLTIDDFVERIKTDNEFAERWGELGPIYGHQWRDWTTESGYRNEWVDQIKNLIRDLKENPDSRRLMVSAWNVGELGEMVLPPCHYGFQVYTRELSFDERKNLYKKEIHFSILSHEDLDVINAPKRTISLSWNQRSVDTFLGLPFNIASYGMLLTLLGKEVNMVPEFLIGNLGDTHLYSNHLDQAKEQISREPFEYLPLVNVSNVDILDGEFDYEIIEYESHPTIKAPLSN